MTPTDPDAALPSLWDLRGCLANQPTEGEGVPDPAATELARCVAWLRARADKFDAEADGTDSFEHLEYCEAVTFELRKAATDLERGEQP